MIVPPRFAGCQDLVFARPPGAAQQSPCSSALAAGARMPKGRVGHRTSSTVARRPGVLERNKEKRGDMTGWACKRREAEDCSYQPPQLPPKHLPLVREAHRVAALEQIGGSNAGSVRCVARRNAGEACMPSRPDHAVRRRFIKGVVLAARSLYQSTATP